MTDGPLAPELAGKHDRALALIRGALDGREGKLAVAFSGGVDSTLLLKLAVIALGPDRVVAVTARSESLPAEELAACERIAAAIGVKLTLVRTHELARPGYVENSPSRCYHCKTELFETLDREVARLEGVAVVAYGAIADDLAEGQHRPGMKAASEHGVIRPLADAGLWKADVRALSSRYGLETWDKPQMACLASRIPYGQAVTAQKLSRVEQAERVLRGLGFRELRVRHHSDGATDWARLEVAESELAKAVTAPARETIARELRALGFKFVTLDLEGFRSGRLNEGWASPSQALAGTTGATAAPVVASPAGADVASPARRLPLA